MPGLHSIIYGSEEIPTKKRVNISESLLENYFKIKIINETLKSLIAISYHEGYPFSIYKYNNTLIVLDGIVYNYNDSEIQFSLKKIAEKFNNGDKYENIINEFVQKEDVDYIVQILELNKNKMLIFNDYLGRLPFYYYSKNDINVFSREIKIILEIIPKIIVDRSGITEFLLLGYSLGKKTYFKNIYRLNPAQMLTLDSREKENTLRINNSTDFNFILDTPFSNQNRSIEYIKNAFMESTENRIKTLQRKGHRIISDLSGGYDTRTILAGLSRYTNDVQYNTFEYVVDESYYSEEIFKNFGSPGSFQKLKIGEKTNLKDLDSLIYKTEGLVNYKTTSGCYRDLESLKFIIPEITSRFSGLGGEFIRHPLKLYYKSLFDSFKNNLYSPVPLDVACRITKKNRNVFLQELNNYFKEYPEKTPQDKLKRLYFEYYNHLVWMSEDRERAHFWTVQPLSSLKLLKAINTRLPFSWIGYKYYIDFMKSVDPRLLNCPIFESKINLNSDLSIRIFESKNKLMLLIRKSVILLTPFSYKIYKFFHNRKMGQKVSEKDILENYHKYYKKIDFAKDLFDFTYINDILFKYSNALPLNLVTQLIYFSELEKRFKDKLELAD